MTSASTGPDESARLAFLLPSMAGGGAERVALRLIEDFVSQGFEVDLLLLRAEGELLGLVPRSVRIVDLAAPRIRDSIVPLIRYLRKRRPHAMQVSLWPLTAAAIVARKLAGVKTRVVVSDHAALSRQYHGFARTLLKWSTRALYPMADARIIVAAAARDDLAVLSGLAPESIEVIYNPVAAPPPAGEGPGVEPMWGDAKQRLMTVGTLKDQKNHALLIRAFARVDRALGATLMILGQGPLLGRLREIAEEEGAADRILFPGFTVDPWPYYRAADMFVLSSDYEGYPLVLLEAMRCGLQIVSTDCESGPREILDGGRYGALVPCGDADAFAAAIEQGLNRRIEPELLRARAEELSGTDTSARYLELMLG